MNEPVTHEKRSGTPVLDEITPATPPRVANLKLLLPSMPTLGEISSYSPSSPNDLYTHTSLSITPDDPTDVEIATILQPTVSNAKTVSADHAQSDTNIDRVISETNLIPSRTLVSRDEAGNYKTFSNIKAPPLLECRPFKCDKCKKRYAYLGNLYRHKRSKHDAQCYLFECPFCMYRNGRKDNLKKHIKADHPDEHMPRKVPIQPFDPRQESIKPISIRPVEAVTKTVQAQQNEHKKSLPKFRIIEKRTPERPPPSKARESPVIMSIDSTPQEIRSTIKAKVDKTKKGKGGGDETQQQSLICSSILFFFLSDRRRTVQTKAHVCHLCVEDGPGLTPVQTCAI